VRIGGKWQRGRNIEWVREIGRDGWDCVIIADEPVSGPPWQGRYAFDPRSIRPRDTEQPPADLLDDSAPRRNAMYILSSVAKVQRALGGAS
jgi:hypothetical protein